MMETINNKKTRMERQNIRRIMKVLSKSYSWEILNFLHKEGKKYVAQLSEELSLAYSTVQLRVNELEKEGLVICSDKLHPLSKRPIKEVKLKEFLFVLTPEKYALLYQDQLDT